MVKPTTRATNWDLLRSLAMLFVVITHSGGYLGPIGGIGTHGIISPAAIICDPVFFALSGYFALKPVARGLKEYYLGKVPSIIMPLVVYSILLYVYASWQAGFVGFSLGDYFAYFGDLMHGGWWFIPTLIPCLVAAPFLARALEAFSDGQVRALGVVTAVLFLSGIVLPGAQWFFDRLEVETLSSLAYMIASVVHPSVLSPMPAFFQFFVLGGIYRRLAPTISPKAGTRAIVVGMACWVLDVVWRYFGLPWNDPSFFWLFATWGIMVLFGRLRIQAPVACRAISWTAQRSYSIYLLQYATILVVAGLVYDQAVLGDVGDMVAPLRILMWMLFVAGAYLLALMVASVIDPLVLKPLQDLFKRHFMKPKAPKGPAAGKESAAAGDEAAESRASGVA